MPQDWLDHWPLTVPGGTKSKGLDYEQIIDRLEANPSDSLALLSKQRNEAKETIGNLTIITQPLNSAVSNSDWNTKKPQLLAASLLPINQQLIDYQTWSEESIKERAEKLFKEAKEIWGTPRRQTQTTRVTAGSGEPAPTSH